MPDLENHADATHYVVGFPVIEKIGIAERWRELEIARFIGALGVPLADDVSQGAAEKVSVIENRLRVARPGFGSGKVGAEFRGYLGLEESVIRRGTELVFENARQFEQQHVVAGEFLSVYDAGGKKDLVDLSMKSQREMGAEAEHRAGISGKFRGVFSGIGRKANLAARDDAGVLLFCVRADNDEVGIDHPDGGAGGRQSSESVGGLSRSDSDCSALTEGRTNHSKQQAREKRKPLAGLDHESPPVGKSKSVHSPGDGRRFPGCGLSFARNSVAQMRA